MLENARKHERERESGQTTLFDMFGDDSNTTSQDFSDPVPEPNDDEWDKMELLKQEKGIMNMYVTDNPVRPYMPQITDQTKFNMAQLAELEYDIPNGTFGGMISDVAVMRTKRGKLMSKFQLEDTTGKVETICFNHEKFADKIVEDKIVLIKGKFEKGDRGDQIIAYEIMDLILNPNYVPTKPVAAAPQVIEPFEIFINESDINEQKINQMNRALQNNFGVQDVFLHIAKSDGKTVKAQMPFKVKVEDTNLKYQLNTIFNGNVKFN